MKSLSLLVIALFASLATFAQSPIRIAFLGNSITQGPGRDNPGSYPLQVGALLGDSYEVKNFGVSGRTLLKKGDFPIWNEPQFQEAKDFTPDVLVIKLGTNDSKPQNWAHKADFVKDYLDLIAEFRTHMPADGKVYIVIPVPVTRENFGINPDVMNNEQRLMLYEIIQKSGAEAIDLYTPLMNKAELLPDGVHPNKEGLTIMANVIARRIRL
ncbi:MAG: GDSL-type esterase/lipase family protein [Algoriphagus sp.]|uniref:GDSL-type esterase/lipase family protein n=1 Tax=Algoriphagus sp. TaxID=1872435 RepID=UPI00271C61E4|nr:GDSL-type esterase/lipase family protein [Algoriphagus sp.]MDO8968487.1 GDSL-type esterase/lipase family protein [Algoriphagus sp.]MDP2043434.1 GDSL-type esterase/lipase family protein [Algoriphagus sp.]MDP3200736.1 GDSL-type esterase/lipase family protein [Algoriphagus sp.]MDP3470439.1 GDSL-type esterase/lipase family protein [Algoriphagus sp.]